MQVAKAIAVNPQVRRCQWGGALLGLLALLIGFAFSMSLNRFADRKEKLLEEINDIQTAYLRIDLLPEASQCDMRKLFKDYVILRVDYYKRGAGHQTLQSIAKSTTEKQNEMWRAAMFVCKNSDKDRAIIVNSFVSALNNVLDDQTKRTAARENHVPEAILWVLFSIACLAVGAVGYSAGFNQTRLLSVRIILIFCITLTLTLIMDLDRPRRGLIQVDQGGMKDLLIYMDNCSS